MLGFFSVWSDGGVGGPDIEVRRVRVPSMEN